MTNDNPDRDIARHLGEAVRDRLARRAIRDLQSMKESLLSGDFSELQSTWDEVCVQVQVEESFSWGAYLETIRACVDCYVEGLKRHELEAVWLVTPEGDDWQWEDENEREPFAPYAGDVAQHVIDCVLAQAGSWSNSRIRAYLDRH
jgi:hypothetical protein